MRAVLQVPLSPAIRDQALVAAQELGFSSLQEAVRVLLAKLAARRLTISIEETVTPLSPASEKRYAGMDSDFAANKNIRTAKTVTDLMNQLHRNPQSGLLKTSPIGSPRPRPVLFYHTVAASGCGFPLEIRKLSNKF